jgi:hypothetical protein
MNEMLPDIVVRPVCSVCPIQELKSRTPRIGNGRVHEDLIPFAFSDCEYFEIVQDLKKTKKQRTNVVAFVDGFLSCPMESDIKAFREPPDIGGIGGNSAPLTELLNGAY